MPICKKCQKSFSIIVVEGQKKLNIHTRKFCFDCSPFRGGNTIDISKFKPKTLPNEVIPTNPKLCAKCQQILPANSFHIVRRHNKIKLSSYCKRCNHIRTLVRQRRFKEAAIQYKGGKCEDCELRGHRDLFDFHHLDPTKKDFAISSNKHLMLNEVMKKELDKCALLCANCHRLRHAKTKIEY